jgi:uncharacterized protein (UPF0147 family)
MPGDFGGVSTEKLVERAISALRNHAGETGVTRLILQVADKRNEWLRNPSFEADLRSFCISVLGDYS